MEIYVTFSILSIEIFHIHGTCLRNIRDCSEEDIWLMCAYRSTTAAERLTTPVSEIYSDMLAMDHSTISADLPTTVSEVYPPPVRTSRIGILSLKKRQTMTSQNTRLKSTTGNPTTMAEATLIKIRSTADEIANPTEIAKTTVPFFRQAKKCDINEGAIMALSIIAGVSFIANGMLSILLFRSCRQRPGENDTTPFNTIEATCTNASKEDQTEMYSGLQFSDDSSAYQTLAGENDVPNANS